MTQRSPDLAALKAGGIIKQRQETGGPERRNGYGHP